MIQEMDVWYDDEEIDRKKAKAAGIGTAVGFTIGFFSALLIMYWIGVNL